MNVVVTDLFSSENNTYFYTNIQCSHSLLTDFSNINTLSWLCRGTQNRIYGLLEIILSSKMRLSTVNCTYITKLSSFNLERWSKTSTENVHVPRTDEVILKVMILWSSPQSLSPHSATFIFEYPLILAGIRSIERLKEKAKQQQKSPFILQNLQSLITFLGWWCRSKKI